MDVKTISERYTVSGQIAVEDLSELKSQGVELLICNRPDGEAEGQPSYAAISSAALDLGMEVANIPFKGGQLTLEQVIDFNQQMARGLKTHAYCRTGNRCTIIWEQGQKLSD